MKSEYRDILDEMVTNDGLMRYLDGRNLAMDLCVLNVITLEEKFKLETMGPRSSAQHLMYVVLKSKLDDHMTHFLEALKNAGYLDAHTWLQEKLQSCDNTQPMLKKTKVASSARQNAATSAIGNVVSDQKISSDKERLLKRAFMDHSTIDLLLYIPHLEMLECLTHDEVELISHNSTLSGKQVMLMNLLCAKSMDVLRQLERIARKNGHVHFANDLKDILQKP